MAAMFGHKLCWALALCICVAVANNNLGTKRQVENNTGPGLKDIKTTTSSKAKSVGKTAEEINTQSDGKKSDNNSPKRYTSVGPTEQLNIRTRREIRSLVEALKANGEKLEKLTHGMDILVKSVNNETTGYLDIMNRLESMNPFFVSMYVMLADVAFSSSPRIAKHREDVVNMSRYFRENIMTKTDLAIFDDEMFSVLKWYMYDGTSSVISCVDMRNAGLTKSGVYTIRIPNSQKVLNVSCDQDTDGGGWLVIQRRQDGSEDFYRSWSDYQRGFGNIEGEFWLGNDNLHDLTSTAQELRVDLMDFDGNTAYAKYSSFAVGSSSGNFALTISGYSGTAGDSMSGDNGARFSTEDSGSSCAKTYKGPWWHKICYYANLNGLYFHTAKISTESLSWYHWKSSYVALKKSEMKIRPRT